MHRRAAAILAALIALEAAASAQGGALSGTGAAATGARTDESSPGAQAAIIADDPAELLGLDVGGAFARFGAPASVYALRGEEAWQDDVAFVYPAGYSLFWYGDRLWQVRIAPPYAGSVYGLFIGDSADKVYSTLGTPYEKSENALVYRMPFKDYPVRLRLLLRADRVADVYVYRADF